ncbi:MAG TPA: phosphatidate cytidylyltransferase [Gammaproteobacteria bacterium]
MLAQRIVTALVLGAAVVAGVLLLPTAGVLALFGVLWLAGAWEWAQFAQLAGGRRLLFVGLMTCLLLPALWPMPAAVVVAALLVALAWWALALGAVVTYPRTYGTAAAVLAGFVTLLPPWYLLAYLHRLEPDGHWLTLLALAIVWAADIGAYFVGRSLGRVKLAPAVSPGKTWEGVAGGLAAAALVAAAASWPLGLPAGPLVLVCVVAAAVSVLGDLNVSLFKRNVGLKDSGTLLPGHGGVLDRIDSLTAAIPVFTLGLRVLGLRG